ncbi:unnamed protein product [Phytophthora fragariaefolia]|uniref:Unnamed protein product n=1 Tax=Phytophthora fragariaefolia TaxID=1490495 RepID=A0A9W6TY16_9STRA|nr:unnamed protein product [Phytophthora fragariaefolia]
MLPRPKAKSPHKGFISDDNDDKEEDEDYEPDAGEVDAEDAQAEVEVAPPLKPAKAKRKSKAKLPSKSTRPRKPTAAQLAKQVKEARRATSELRCIVSAAAEVEGHGVTRNPTNGSTPATSTTPNASDHERRPASPPQSRNNLPTGRIIQHVLTDDVVCCAVPYNMKQQLQWKKIQHLHKMAGTT